MQRPERYPAEARERAVRLVRERQAETLRTRVPQAEMEPERGQG